ncbi:MULTISPECIES: aconitase X swivel domain-containing protein [Sporomusa]|uniref:aconitase X swivel domain-containing protein n=1 Tax=Sporomusa TaxID=2375 RepID=UPI002030939E|nr:DUF126 domain-containing protein [Sporomusa sphaeroides]MCM0758187.1 DUF126 domain-containing protein [Sporomusa sphaeroides DSM 2875]
MNKIILKGRPAFAGIAEGEALVCPDSIAGNTGALGDSDGVIYEHGNPNRGKSIKDKVLVLPCSKGSCGWSCHFKATKVYGNAPAGWVVTKIDSRIGVAIVSLEKPAVVDFVEADPVKLIKTGDWVKIDGSTGIVEITPK